MSKRIKIYSISNDYINYLHNFDKRVPFNKNGKRPFVGVVYLYNNIRYFAPLSSPKAKHLKIPNGAIDIFKIKNGELGLININNMIPTPMEVLTELIPTIENKKYKSLLIDQLKYINYNSYKLLYKVNTFYKLYESNKLTYNEKKENL